MHDWFTEKGGAENVVSSLLEIFPDAEFFALVDFFDDEQRKKVLKNKKVTTTFIERLPFAKRLFRYYLVLFPLAIERLDLRKFDLVISSSYAVAKGVMTGPFQLHISYCHSPMRYAWDMYFPYLEEHEVRGFREKLLSYVLHKIRVWDVVSSNRVDHFIANSTLVQRRIEKYYRRRATIIHPPVDTERFSLCREKEDYYFTASRLVPYKKIKMIVQTFAKNGKRLVVAGKGPQLKHLKTLAAGNVVFLDYVDDAHMVELMQRARAFVFAAYEDFGILPVEAMACGTPVIAYGKGGICDTLVEGKTGLFFDDQTVESLDRAIEKFETMEFDYEEISRYASKFSKERFEAEVGSFIEKRWELFRRQ
ncbi:glycosyltransferase [Hydrogenimonas sp.]